MIFKENILVITELCNPEENNINAVTRVLSKKTMYIVNKNLYKELYCCILISTSQQCQSRNHQSCPTQIQMSNEQTNCQCSCNSRSDQTRSRS
jgi:hypothetical protein